MSIDDFETQEKQPLGTGTKNKGKTMSRKGTQNVTPSRKNPRGGQQSGSGGRTGGGGSKRTTSKG